MRIGICGTGKMGAAIARRLMACGHDLTVWNRNADRAAPLVAEGAKSAASPAALAAAVEIIITIVLDAPALDAVFRAPNGLLTVDLAGKLVIEMSTVLPETEEALAADVTSRGGKFVECPVGGTVKPALDGKLFGLAAGSDEAIAMARPVLDQLCRRVEAVGAVGSGARVKLAINLPLLVYWQALGEALSLCRSIGLAPDKLIDIMSDTTGAAAGIKLRGPEIARGLGGEETGPGSFDITAARKDLQTMLALAARMGVSLPTAGAALGGYDDAIAAGRGNKDAGQLAVFWATRA